MGRKKKEIEAFKAMVVKGVVELFFFFSSFFSKRLEEAQSTELKSYLNYRYLKTLSKQRVLIWHRIPSTSWNGISHYLVFRLKLYELHNELFKIIQNRFFQQQYL